MAQELELLAKGSATPENISTIQAAVFRAQALQSAIKTKPSQGEKAHALLTYHEVERLMEVCYRRSNGTKGICDLLPKGPAGHRVDDGCGSSP